MLKTVTPEMQEAEKKALEMGQRLDAAVKSGMAEYLRLSMTGVAGSKDVALGWAMQMATLLGLTSGTAAAKAFGTDWSICDASNGIASALDLWINADEENQDQRRTNLLHIAQHIAELAMSKYTPQGQSAGAPMVQPAGVEIDPDKIAPGQAVDGTSLGLKSEDYGFPPGMEMTAIKVHKDEFELMEKGEITMEEAIERSAARYAAEQANAKPEEHLKDTQGNVIHLDITKAPKN